MWRKGENPVWFWLDFKQQRFCLEVLLLLGLPDASADHVGVAWIEWRQSYSLHQATQFEAHLKLAWGQNFLPIWEFAVLVEPPIYFGRACAYLLGWLWEVPITFWAVAAEIIQWGDALNPFTEMCSFKVQAVLSWDEGRFLLPELLSVKCYSPL